MRSSNEFLPSLPGYQISKSAAAKKMKQNFYMLEGQTFYKDDNSTIADDDSSTTYVIGKSRVGTATQRPKTTIRMSQEPEVIFSFSAFYAVGSSLSFWEKGRWGRTNRRQQGCFALKISE